ncbi:cytochrome P450 [Ilyonectria sp. MPI-CAGE-AT-0026]|nr:cytochrome P450 [Ilyonectria sp. MPI-CAGE-AT-0026]
MASECKPIPRPPRIPLLGNVGDIDMEFPLRSLTHFATKYGAIYKLTLAGKKLVFVSSYDYVHETCDDTRFQKSIEGELEELRDAVHDGLFTSKGASEPNWGIAHRVLMTAFGPLAIRGMFDEMHDVAGQLAMKWARHGPSTAIQVGEDLTRLTLDTVALCSMGFRFNSYYRDDMHPFIAAMYAVLKEAGDKTMRVLPSVFHKSADRKYKANINILRTTANEVLQSRKKEGESSGRKDLLTAMLNGVDPVTGCKMTDESIIDNLITFLVAGHETTAATFTFTIYQLLKHPEVYRKVQQEVDDVIGKGPILVEHVGKLKYLSAVIREVLRLSAPIPAFAREAIKDETIGGMYKVKAGEQIICMLSKSHLDPAVFGDTAEEFEPERMMDENFDRLMKEFPHCWAPFGTGMRGCIGRAFAWQEMTLALALLMQNFNFVMDNPSYILQISQTLTIKPKDFNVRAILRDGLTPTLLESRLAGSFRGDLSTGSGTTNGEGVKANRSSSSLASTSGENMKKLAIYYGSNAGTCEFMAQRLASDATAQGFKATVDSLDAAREALPTDGPVVIITASYEGQPPHNAAHFVDWIGNLKGTPFKDVSYAVYGCGHGDWVKTYQRVPTLVDSTLEELGAHRVCPLGSTNAKDRDMFTDFETWEDETLWPALAKQFGGRTTDDKDVETGLSVSFSTPRALTLRQDVKEAAVVEARTLEPGETTVGKRHIALALPSDMVYSAGDYLAVLPHNPKESVARVMRRFHLAWDCHVTIAASSPTTLPTDTSIPVTDVLNSYVELNQPATKRNIQGLYELAKEDALKQKIKQFGIDGYDTEVKSKRLSVLDIVERFPDLPIPLSLFLQILPPMRVRQYSISSSPLSNPGIASLTYSVLDQPALSGNGRHLGVTTSYLSSLAVGEKLQVSVRKAAGTFRLPVNMENIPIICIGAGTGMAPFRAFIQERAILLESGRTLAPASFFFGCRDPGVDDLYREEFDKWEAAGAVTIFRAYSAKPAASLGCKYVQDRIWRERKTLVDLWQKDARIFVCGSNKMASDVKDVIFRIIMEQSGKPGDSISEEATAAWFESVRNERYATDVFD